MEVKNLKMTYNMEYADCIEASFPVFMDIVAQQEGSQDVVKRTNNVNAFLSQWKPFFKEFVRETAD